MPESERQRLSTQSKIDNELLWKEIGEVRKQGEKRPRSRSPAPPPEPAKGSYASAANRGASKEATPAQQQQQQMQQKVNQKFAQKEDMGKMSSPKTKKAKKDASPSNVPKDMAEQLL